MYYPMRFPTWLIYLGAFLIFATILTHNWSDSDRPKPSKTISPTLHGNFLHITDFHPDPYYTTNATARSACHVKDIELYKKPKHMKKGKAGPWGAPATICDSPMGLVNTTFQWLEKHWSEKLDFVIWTGDNSRHDNDDMRPRKLHEIFDLNRMVAKKFMDLFAANKRRHLPRGVKNAPLLIPIVPSLGNNDLYPNNVIEAGPNHILNTYIDIWSAFIPKKQINTFRQGGYYFTEVIPGRLIVISLNTMYFYDANTAVRGCKSESEPGTAEMKWLEGVLRNARKSGVKVYVTGHVAPTKKHYTPSCWLKYGQIAHKYHDTILGHLYGHSNMDHFYFIKRRSNKKRSRANLADAYYDDDDFDLVDNEEEVVTSKNSQSEDGEADTMSEDLQSEDSEVDTTSENLQSKDSEIDTTSEHSQSKDGEVGTTVFDVNHYIHGLFSHFKAIPPRYNKMADRYAVIHVNPSVIPTFFPALRIYHYNATQFEVLNTQDDAKNRFPWGDSPDEEIDYDEEEDDDDGDEDAEGGKKKKRPHHPHDPNSPPHRNTFLTPVGYTQYFINLTKANQFPDITPEYEVEYTTMKDYRMKDLTINSWLSLARRIANDGLKGSLGKKFRQHLVVGTKDVVKNRKAGMECIEGGCGLLKGPVDYLASLGGF